MSLRVRRDDTTTIEHEARASVVALRKALGIPEGARVQSLQLDGESVVVRYTTTERNGVFYMSGRGLDEEGS